MITLEFSHIVSSIIKRCVNVHFHRRYTVVSLCSLQKVHSASFSVFIWIEVCKYQNGLMYSELKPKKNLISFTIKRICVNLSPVFFTQFIHFWPSYMSSRYFFILVKHVIHNFESFKFFSLFYPLNTLQLLVYSIKLGSFFHCVIFRVSFLFHSL